jgi:hypothetical protein
MLIVPHLGYERYPDVAFIDGSKKIPLNCKPYVLSNSL